MGGNTRLSTSENIIIDVVFFVNKSQPLWIKGFIFPNDKIRRFYETQMIVRLIYTWKYTIIVIIVFFIIVNDLRMKRGSTYFSWNVYKK